MIYWWIFFFSFSFFFSVVFVLRKKTSMTLWPHFNGIHSRIQTEISRSHFVLLVSRNIIWSGHTSFDRLLELRFSLFFVFLCKERQHQTMAWYFLVISRTILLFLSFFCFFCSLCRVDLRGRDGFMKSVIRLVISIYSSYSVVPRKTAHKQCEKNPCFSLSLWPYRLPLQFRSKFCRWIYNVIFLSSRISHY